MKRFNTIKCPRCGEQVRLPILWRCGLERVFYCDACKLYFKLDYRIGAIVVAIALLVATVVFQILGLLGGFGVVLCLLFIIPVFYVILWITRRYTLVVITKYRLKYQSKRKDIV